MYFECKANLDLDSEKSKATDNKVKDISEFLKKNQELPVVSGVLNCWYKKEDKLPIKVKNVFFFEDLLNILNFDLSSEEYYKIMREFGEKI